MSDRILKALGATDEHDGLCKVAEASEFMTNLREVTGRETYAESLEVIRNAVSLSRELGKITDKGVSAEQLGTVLAWKSSHAALPELSAKVGELEEAGRQRDISALIKAGLSTAAASAENPYAGKLTPAMAKFWETRSAVELEEYLKVAARVIPGEAKPAATNLNNPANKNSSGRAANEKGQTYEQIKPAELAALKKSDRDLYNALREDWIAAGKPVNEALAASN